MGPAPGFKGDDDKTRQGSRVLGIVPAWLSFERWFGATWGCIKSVSWDAEVSCRLSLDSRHRSNIYHTMMPRVRNEFSDITTDCAYEYLMDRLQEMRRQDEEEPQTTTSSSSSTSRSNSTGSSSPRLLTMPILSKLQNAVQPCEFILALKQGSVMLTLVFIVTPLLSITTLRLPLPRQQSDLSRRSSWVGLQPVWYANER